MLTSSADVHVRRHLVAGFVIAGALEVFMFKQHYFLPGTLRPSYVGGRVACGIQFRTQHLVCVRVSVCWRPSLVGWRPSLVGWRWLEAIAGI